MKKFRFQFMNQSGFKQNGIMYAMHREEVLNYVSLQYQILLRVEEELWWKSPFAKFGKKLLFSNQELSLLCKQLTFLLQSGIPLSEVLHMMIEESKLPSQSLFFMEIAQAIDAGHPFSDSLERWKAGLPRLFIQSVRAGELSGDWETIFSDLAEFYQKEHQSNQQSKQAMYYPILLLAVTALVCFFLITIIVPNFISLYANGKSLPWPTMLLLLCYQYRFIFLLSLSGVITLGTVILPFMFAIPKFQYRCSSFLIKLPKLGAFLVKQDLIRFCHTFSLLLAHGLEINAILPVCAELLQSSYLRKCLQEVSQQIEEGIGFSTSMKEITFWPTGFVRMMQMGETGNRLQETMKDAAVLYELEVNSQIQAWQRMIEPGLIIFISLAVGFLAYAILLPMMDQWQGYQMI